MNLTVKFGLKLLGILALVFGAHLFVLNLLSLPLFENKIELTYVVNFLLALVIFFVMIHFREKLKNTLGFVFMGSSLLKFAVFFLVFYPSYNSDGATDKLEFLAFFVTYSVSLSVEVYSLIKIMNKS